ncbi:MgtC/SapB family protein [Thermoleophilum album]|uniref:MgtC/SapB family protein n=1 Tax=Thermoleophilum album TaxID=29539 RepID=UPI00237C79E9|nr:MgtC/SapB family protein [Thermoleophilum album]WDT93490.1 MgtC/SapB family protein [Thermoleophilum album]
MRGIGIDNWELVARLALAVVLCGLVGLEREARDQPAGLRTHILVGLGSALFTLVSAYAFGEFRRAQPGPGGTVVSYYDPTRIAAQIVAGIGFLGAGAIIRQGINVRGLTTAAALWISAAVGMAAGAGFYLGAVATTVFALVALVGLRSLRERLAATVRRDFVLLEVALASAASLHLVLSFLAEEGIDVEGLRSARGDDRTAYVLELRVPPGCQFPTVLDALRALDGVLQADATGVRARH